MTILILAEEGGIEPRAAFATPMFSKQVPGPPGLHLPLFHIFQMPLHCGTANESFTLYKFLIIE
jgi:hypothetical protein